MQVLDVVSKQLIHSLCCKFYIIDHLESSEAIIDLDFPWSQCLELGHIVVLVV